MYVHVLFGVTDRNPRALFFFVEIIGNPGSSWLNEIFFYLHITLRKKRAFFLSRMCKQSVQVFATFYLASFLGRQVEEKYVCYIYIYIHICSLARLFFKCWLVESTGQNRVSWKKKKEAHCLQQKSCRRPCRRQPVQYGHSFFFCSFVAKKRNKLGILHTQANKSRVEYPGKCYYISSLSTFPFFHLTAFFLQFTRERGLEWMHLSSSEERQEVQDVVRER